MKSVYSVLFLLFICSCYKSTNALKCFQCGNCNYPSSKVITRNCTSDRPVCGVILIVLIVKFFEIKLIFINFNYKDQTITKPDGGETSNKDCFPKSECGIIKTPDGTEYKISCCTKDLCNNSQRINSKITIFFASIIHIVIYLIIKLL